MMRITDPRELHYEHGLWVLWRGSGSGLCRASGVVLLKGSFFKQQKWGALIETCAILQCLATGSALIRLITLYINSDTSVVNVALNSQMQLPVLYKLIALWSNHEGSWLLWLFFLSLVGALFAIFNRHAPPDYRAKTLSIHGVTIVGFYLFLIFTSNPFVRLINQSIPAQGLNPLLEDFSLGFHPPILYLSYAGFSLVFAQAITVLWQKGKDQSWVYSLQSWNLLSWSLLTIGLAWGSWWAYYELGWGGWWFWDPVENAALVPWITSTTLIHSLNVTQKQNTLKNWSLLLSLTTFVVCLIGIVFVRSGLVTTVHAFAIDPNRGVFLVILVGAIIITSYLLFAFKKLQSKPPNTSLLSREGTLFLASIGFFFLSATILFATFYPIGLEAMTGQKISVGAPYFNTLLVPLALPLMVMMGFAALQSWKPQSFTTLCEKLLPAFIATMVVFLLVWVLNKQAPLMASAALGFAAWIVSTTLLGIWHNARTLKKIPRKTLNMTLAHLGFAMTLVGMTSDVFWQQHQQLALKPGQHTQLAGHLVQFVGTQQITAPYFQAMNASFTMDDKKLATAQRRLYTQQKIITSKTGLLRDGFSHMYISLGEFLSDDKWLISLTWHPFVLWIWFGAVIMALGGFLALITTNWRQT
ncbi:MAG: heme lyase CcmF/NrfE family subunit [Pseudomonadota bacterium]